MHLLCMRNWDEVVESSKSLFCIGFVVCKAFYFWGPLVWRVLCVKYFNYRGFKNMIWVYGLMKNKFKVKYWGLQNPLRSFLVYSKISWFWLIFKYITSYCHCRLAPLIAITTCCHCYCHLSLVTSTHHRQPLSLLLTFFVIILRNHYCHCTLPPLLSIVVLHRPLLLLLVIIYMPPPIVPMPSLSTIAIGYTLNLCYDKQHTKGLLNLFDTWQKML